MTFFYPSCDQFKLFLQQTDKWHQINLLSCQKQKIEWKIGKMNFIKKPIRVQVNQASIFLNLRYQLKVF